MIQCLKWLSSKGFTLIEMLISITIFMLFLAILAGSYTSLVSANRSANDNQKLYREVRYVFDTLAQEIHSGEIDYSCIDEAHLDVLCLDNQGKDQKTVLSILHNGRENRSLYKFADGKLFTLKQNLTPAGWTSLSDWQVMASDALKLENLSFKIFPLQNPYESAYAAKDEIQWQPSVTILLKAGGTEFRTTYGSRMYGKKSIYE